MTGHWVTVNHLRLEHESCYFIPAVPDSWRKDPVEWLLGTLRGWTESETGLPCAIVEHNGRFGVVPYFLVFVGNAKLPSVEEISYVSNYPTASTSKQWLQQNNIAANGE